jgi:hypothetical protein
MTNEKSNEMNEERALDRGHELAFPLSTGSGYPSTGMTKREYMATQLMSGFLTQGYTSDVAADRSIKAVDDLLIALYVNREQ